MLRGSGYCRKTEGDLRDGIAGNVAGNLQRSVRASRRQRGNDRAQSRPLVATEARIPGVGNCQISKSGSGGRKGARIDLLVGLAAVQFDKIDQHQPVRRLTIFLRLGKQGALVW